MRSGFYTINGNASVTTSVSRALSTAEQIFYDLTVEPLTDAGLAALFSYCWYLNWWPLNAIITGAVRGFEAAKYAQLVMVVDVETIKLLNSAHQAAYDSASEQLKVIATDQGVNSDAYNEASQKFAASLSAFLNYNR